MAIFRKNVHNILFVLSLLIILYGAYRALFGTVEGLGKKQLNKLCADDISQCGYKKYDFNDTSVLKAFRKAVRKEKKDCKQECKEDYELLGYRNKRKCKKQLCKTKTIAAELLADTSDDDVSDPETTDPETTDPETEEEKKERLRLEEEEANPNPNPGPINTIPELCTDAERCCTDRYANNTNEEGECTYTALDPVIKKPITLAEMSDTKLQPTLDHMVITSFELFYITPLLEWALADAKAKGDEKRWRSLTSATMVLVGAELGPWRNHFPNYIWESHARSQENDSFRFRAYKIRDVPDWKFELDVYTNGIMEDTDNQPSKQFKWSWDDDRCNHVIPQGDCDGEKLKEFILGENKLHDVDLYIPQGSNDGKDQVNKITFVHNT